MANLTKNFQLAIDHLISLYNLIILKINTSTNYVFASATESVEQFIIKDFPLIVKHMISWVNYVYFKTRYIMCSKNESSEPDDPNDE